MINHDLFKHLMYAIGGGEGVVDMLKDKNAQEIKEILLAKVTNLNGTTYLTYKEEIKEVSLAIPQNDTYTLLTYAIFKRNDQAIEDILQIAKKNNILEIILSSAADDLHKAIIDKNEKKIVKFNRLLNKPDIMRRILETGKFKNMFTQKKINELAKKVNEGKHGEVINIVRKRVIEHTLFNNLISAIREDKGVANILENAQEIKEVLLTRRVFYFKSDGGTCTPLAYAIFKGNDQAIEDILQKAQEQENNILEIILSGAANNLYEAIIDRNKETIAKWVDHLLSKHRDATSQIFKVGMFKYIFTQKETNVLAEKVNEGKYGEVINTIRKRQALSSGIFGIILTAVAIGAFAGGIVAVTSTITSVSVAVVAGIVIGLATIIGPIGLLVVGYSIYHGLSKIEVSDLKLGAEEKPKAELGDVNSKEGGAKRQKTDVGDAVTQL